MAKVIFEYDKFEDKDDVRLHMKAGDLMLAISEIYQKLFRTPLKYGELPDEEHDLREKMKEEFFAIINEYELSEYI